MDDFSYSVFTLKLIITVKGILSQRKRYSRSGFIYDMNSATRSFEAVDLFV